MKTRLSFLAITLVALLVAQPVKAASIDFTGKDYQMGLVSIGQEGTIDNAIKKYGDYLSGVAFGYLPPNSQITFTYTFSNNSGSKGFLYVDASFEEKVGHYRHMAFTSSEGGDYSYVKNLWDGTKTPVPSPIIATANMGGDKKSGVTTIANNSIFDIHFTSFFQSYYEELCKNGGLDVSVHYLVSALDPAAHAPLPDTLLLMATALLILMGFSRYKKLQALKRSSR